MTWLASTSSPGQRISLAEAVQQVIADYIKPGDKVVDATVGNGFDTLFLARQVGEQGRVYGFDIQATALQHCQQRLSAAGLAAQVSLHLLGHESMAKVVPERTVSAVMFNLGYLPRADKACTTGPATTLAALSAAITRLRPGGLISIMAYTGHAGGAEEALAVRRWCESLAPEHFRYQLEIRESENHPPQCSLIQDRG